MQATHRIAWVGNIGEGRHDEPAEMPRGINKGTRLWPRLLLFLETLILLSTIHQYTQVTNNIV